MALTYKSGTSSALSSYDFGNGSGANPYTVTLGAPTQGNDIVVLVWMMGTGVPSTPVVSCSGFTAKTTAVLVGSPNYAYGGMLWKRSAGGETSFSVSYTNGGGAGQIMACVFDGAVRTGDPFDVYNTAQAYPQSPGAIPSCAVNPSVDNTIVLWAAGMDNGWANTSPPVGFTEIADSSQNMCVATYFNATAGNVTAHGATKGTATGFTVVMGALAPDPNPPNGFFALFN